MSKTILVVGFGPGISTAIAEKFGGEGFTVALVARSADRLKAGVAELEKKGVRAAAFPCDVSDPKAVRTLLAQVREKLGPITVLQWTAYGGAAGDLLTAQPADLHAAFDVAVTGLVTAVQAALPDLRAAKDPAVLVTNGGFGYFDPAVDAAAVKFSAMGLAVANAAKHKVVGLLSEKLKADGIYVGEVMVLGVVKGTAFDASGTGTVEPSAVATKFWDLYQARTTVSANVG